jgi:hypothetical protein
MTRQRQRRRQRRNQADANLDPAGLSGWLYADLFLGLTVVFLGSVIFTVATVSGGSNADSTGPLPGGPATTTTTTTTTTVPIQLIEVPNLIGQRTLVAQGLLSGHGLEGVVQEVEHSEESIGVVFEQFPVAGHELTSGSPVVLRIPAPTTTTVAPTTTTTTTTTTIPPTTTTRPLGVEQGYRCFRIDQTLDVNDSDSVSNMVGELRRQLDQAEISGRHAGIALVFGVSPLSDGTGSRNAQRFIDYVFPEIDLFATSARRNFYTGTGGINGGFRLDIYLLATPDDPPLAAGDSQRC